MHCDQGRGCMILEQQMQNKLPIPGKTNFDWYLFYAMAKDYAGKPMCEVGIGDGGSSLTLADLTDKLDLIDSWHQTWVKEPVQDIYIQLKHPANLCILMPTKPILMCMMIFAFIQNTAQD